MIAIKNIFKNMEMVYNKFHIGKKEKYIKFHHMQMEG